MKYLSFLFAITIAFLLISCGAKPEIENVSEIYETSDDSLYIKCADLKGLGDLHIGKTLYKHLKKDKGITKYKDFIESDFTGGFWGIQSGKDMFGGVYFDFDLIRYIEKDKRIKQVEIGDLGHPYQIGELKFDDIVLAFLNDTLVAISVGDDYYKIEQHFIDKYGIGQGYHNFYCKSRGEWGDNNYYIEKKEHTLRMWANENVKLERKYDMESKVVNGETVFSFHGDDYCLITSQTRYNTFLQILEDCKKKYKEEKAKKTKESYKKL